MQLDTVLGRCPLCGIGCNLSLRGDGGDGIDPIRSIKYSISRNGRVVDGSCARGFVRRFDPLTKPTVRRASHVRGASWNERFLANTGCPVQRVRGAIDSVGGGSRSDQGIVCEPATEMGGPDMTLLRPKRSWGRSLVP